MTRSTPTKLRPMVTALLLAVLFPSVHATTGCSSLYDLPDPPPRDTWRHHSLNPAQDEARSHESFLAAEEAVRSFVDAMESEAWEEAYNMLSNETRILLDDLSPDGLGETVLAAGQVTRGGAEYTVDPVDLFVISDLTEIVDEQPEGTVPEYEEQETYRRKEIYVRSSDGSMHHVVVILEEDDWRIHKPRIELTPGAPGRRALDT